MLAALAAVAAPAVAAHEIGTSRVVLSLTPGGEYIVEVAADAAALLARLETLSGHPRSMTVPRERYADLIAALAPTLLDHAGVRFDGVLNRPSFESARIESSDDPDSTLRPPTVILRLRGQVPSGAAAVTWHYDLTSASYALTVRGAGGAAEQTEWLEGGQTGPPFTIR